MKDAAAQLTQVSEAVLERIAIEARAERLRIEGEIGTIQTRA